MVINSLLYLGASFFYWLRYRKFDAYMLILLAFTVTALMCHLYYLNNPDPYKNIELLPFVYLFVVLLIFIHPYRGLDIHISSINIKETRYIKAFTWTVIISGLISLYYTIPEVLELIRSGEWGELRNTLYEDEEDVKLYYSEFERIVKNITGYAHPFIVVMAFYHLSRPKVNKVITTLLFTIWLGNSFFGSMLVASRGMVVISLLEVVLVYLFFKDTIGKKVKKFILIIAIVSLIPVAQYLYDVSISRFGEQEAAYFVFEYLGHSMLNFNENMMVPMYDYADGKYFFNYFLPYFGIDPNINMKDLGYTGGTGFYTFIGSFYIDFGPTGTVLLAILMLFFINYFASKKKKNITDIMVLVFFAKYYLDGVFVIGRGSALEWLMLFVLCVIIKICEKSSDQKIKEYQF